MHKKRAYLDIETNYVGRFHDQRLFSDYANHKITVIGILVTRGRREERFLQMIGRDITRSALLKALHGVDIVITYNGRSKPDNIRGFTGFDFPVIAAQLGVTLDERFDHTDLVPMCWRRGLTGGLKKVEISLGLTRKLPGKDGKWAQEMWRKYVKTKKKGYLKSFLLYNKEDVYMLREVERKLKKIKVEGRVRSIGYNK